MGGGAESALRVNHHLLHNRRNAAAGKPAPGEGLLWKAFTFLMRRPALYRLATRFAPLGSLLHPLVEGSALDPMIAWTSTRDFPAAAPKSFRQHFKAHQAAKASKSGGAK